MARIELLAAAIGVLAATAGAGADTLEAVQARKVLVWGADAQGGAPFEFPDPSDPAQLIGFEVDLAEALAAQLGVGARMQQGAWDKLLELLARGDFDLALSGIEATPDKQSVCLLSHPYYVSPERLTVRRGDASAPRTLAALRGRRAGTLPGSAAERILRAAGAEVATYDGGQDDVYRDLRLGRTDAVLLDETVTAYFGAVDPALEVLPDSFGEVRYAIAMRSGDAALQRAVDGALAALARDGQLRAIYERWGIWNAETAALLGDADATPRGPALAWEAWRASTGFQPPFWVRLFSRYPALSGAFARGAVLTLVVSALAMALAIALGALLASARAFAPKPLAALAVFYVEVFRGTPLLVQLVVLYFGLPELGVTLSPFIAGVVALGLNYAATESENYRAGLASVPASQLDAARVLGLARAQALRFVVFPQAVRISLPPMTNDFIALLKDSSLISVVTLTELTKTYSMLANATHDHLGLGAVVCAWYLAVGLPFVFLARRLERRLGEGQLGVAR
ncbi:MAG TPA: ABC transporter substrate-binding protein/permease [Myxococcota bacterium]|nr:ABC transporter substrate-binding protein/permease [Myxococcota bacterium]